MSEHFLTLIPADPYFVPNRRRLVRLGSFSPNSSQLQMKSRRTSVTKFSLWTKVKILNVCCARSAEPSYQLIGGNKLWISHINQDSNIWTLLPRVVRMTRLTTTS